jgi:outer membrane protein
MRLTRFGVPLAAFFVATGSLHAQAKIGYIDSNRIVSESAVAQAAQAQLNEEATAFQTQISSLEQELQTMITAYQAAADSLPEETRLAREREIITKRTEYEAQARAADSTLTVRQNQLLQPVMDRINQVIEEIRREGQYSAIFDVASGALRAADPALDLTPDVLRRLSAGSNPGSSR